MTLKTHPIRIYDTVMVYVKLLAHKEEGISHIASGSAHCDVVLPIFETV